MLRSAITLCVGVALSVVIAQSGGAQRATAAGDWPMYRHDLCGNRLLAPRAHQHDERRHADARLDLQPAK